MIALYSRIERRKLYEQVAAHLERLILDGVMKPGDRLPGERELQAEFGVGRPAIREALITLQRNGLVEISNGSPARVAMPTASDVLAGIRPAVLQLLSTNEGQRHFQHVRLFLECGLARQAALHVSPDQIEALKLALLKNRNAIGDREEFIRTDIAFHYVLAEMTENPIFTALHNGMSQWLKQQRIVTLQQSGQEQNAYKAHKAIFKAIANHDGDAAEEAMKDHLLQLERTYWSLRRTDDSADMASSDQH